MTCSEKKIIINTCSVILINPFTGQIHFHSWSARCMQVRGASIGHVQQDSQIFAPEGQMCAGCNNCRSLWVLCRGDSAEIGRCICGRRSRGGREHAFGHTLPWRTLHCISLQARSRIEGGGRTGEQAGRDSHRRQERTCWNRNRHSGWHSIATAVPHPRHLVGCEYAKLYMLWTSPIQGCSICV